MAATANHTRYSVDETDESIPPDLHRSTEPPLFLKRSGNMTHFTQLNMDHKSSVSEINIASLIRKHSMSIMSKSSSLETDPPSSKHNKTVPFLKRKNSVPLSLDKQKLKRRFYGMKSKLKLSSNNITEAPDIKHAKNKLKHLKFTTKMEQMISNLYLAQTTRVKCLNMWCDTLTNAHISNTEDKFAIYANNMGQMMHNMEIKNQNYLIFMKDELMDSLNAFNNGTIGKCKELKTRLKLKQNDNKLKKEFLLAVQLMDTEKYMLLKSMKLYMASLGDYAYKLRVKLMEEKHMMQDIPPNMNNVLDLDSDTEDINDNNQTISTFKTWSESAFILKAGWILKRGQQKHFYVHRYFQLFSNRKLIYWNKEGADARLKGHIDLTKVITITKKLGNTLQICTEARVWMLQFNDMHMRDTWYELLNGVVKTGTAMKLQCSHDIVRQNVCYMDMDQEDDDLTVSITDEIPLLSPTRSRSRSMSSSIAIPDHHETIPALEGMQSINEVLSQDTPLEEEEENEPQLEEESVDIREFLALYEIVELVTSPKARGTQHQNVLLNTYSLFTTREELLAVIFKRLLDISGDNAGQIKIISLLKTWLKIENDFVKEDGNIEELTPFALHFCKELMIHTQSDVFLQKLSKPLIAQVSNFSMMECGQIYEEEAFAGAPSSKIPKVKSAKQLNLSMLDPSEVARQICLNEYEIFKKIKPEEFLKQKSSKKKNVALKVTNEEHKLSEEALLKQAKEKKLKLMKNEEKTSTQPNIDKMRDWFNRLSVWTQTEILCEMELNQRCKIVSNLLDICRQLEKYNNISSLCAIRAGLCSAPIHRLRKTWENIPKKAKETMAKFDALFKLGNGQKNLRAKISIISQPAIPHLGIFLGDIVFIHDGNDTFSPDEEKKINWEKMRLLADRIAWISMFQQSQFVFKPVPIISEYLESKMKMVPEDFLYKLSRGIEPPAKKK